MALRSRLLGAAARHPPSAAALRRAAHSTSSSSSSSLAGAAPRVGRRGVAAPASRSAAGGGAAKVKEVPVVDSLEWASPLSIIKYPDPRLRAVNARIGAVDKAQLLKLAGEMFELMYQDEGVGLAAPQVGVNVRLMVFNEHGPPARGGPSETILINPEIVMRSRKTDTDEEGCLSFPKIYADVERADAIDVRWTDIDGKLQEKTLRGWVARIFQHEYDHLQGVLYHDRMKASELSKVREKIVALEETFLAANPNAQVQRLPAEGAGRSGASSSGAKGFGGGGKGFGARR